MCNKTIHGVQGALTSPPDSVSSATCMTTLHVYPGTSIILEIETFYMPQKRGGDMPGTDLVEHEEGIVVGKISCDEDTDLWVEVQPANEPGMDF